MSRLIEPCKQRLWKSKWTEWPKSCGEKALSRNGLEAIVHCYCGKETIKCALLCRKRLAGWLIGMMYCKKGMKVPAYSDLLHV